MDINKFLDISKENCAYIVSKTIINSENKGVNDIILANKALLMDDLDLIKENYYMKFSYTKLNLYYKSNLVKDEDYFLVNIELLDKYLKIENRELDDYVVELDENKNVLNFQKKIIKLYPMLYENQVINEFITFKYSNQDNIGYILELVKDICKDKYDTEFTIAYPINNNDIGKPYNDEKAQKFTLVKYKKKKFSDFKMDNVNVALLLKKQYVYGLTGFENTSLNSYMNSTMQFLTHISHLKQYFIEEKYKNNLNLTKSDGYQGNFAKIIYKIFFKVWKKRETVYKLKKVKNVVKKYNKGYLKNKKNKQVFEFLDYILTNLHEDLNLFNNTEYNSKIHLENLDDDKKLAEISWLEYIKNNLSIINYLFHGQNKSTINCLKCNKNSASFDPFKLLELEIPKNIERKVIAYIYCENNLKNKEKIEVVVKGDSTFVKNYSITSIKELICKNKNFNANDYILINNVNQEELSDNLTLNQLNIEKIDLLLIKKLNEENLDNKIFVRFSLRKMLSFIWEFNYEDTVETFIDRVLGLFKTHIKEDFNVEFEKIKEEFWSLEDDDRFFKFKIYLNKIKLKKEMKLKELLDYNKLIENNYYKDHINFYQKRYKNYLNFKAKMLVVFRRKYDLDPLFVNYIDKQINIDLNKKEFGLKKFNLDELLDLYSQPKKLEDENWKCPHCNEVCEGMKTTQLYKTPSYLIMVMKKIKDNRIQIQKDAENSIEFPLSLDLSKHVLNKEPLGNYNLESLEFDDKEFRKFNKVEGLEYDLFSVINNMGSYTEDSNYTYINYLKKWYEFKDTKVNIIKESEVMTRHAYILIYKKKNLKE